MLIKGLHVEVTKTVSNKTLSLFVMMPLIIAVVLPYALTQEKGMFGMLAFFNVFMISIMDTLISVVEEKEHKTLEAMMITPLGLNTVLLSKVLISVLLVFINSVVILAVIPKIYTIFIDPVSVVLIIGLCGAFSFLYAGLALVIGAYVNNMKEAEQVGTAVATILLFMGFIPLDRMPYLLQEIIKITPLTNGNYIFTSIILDPTAEGLLRLGYPLVITLVFCVIMVWGGFKIFQHKYT